MELTQQLHMHVNGGSKFSVLDYRIFADGEPSDVHLVSRTDGSPEYWYTSRRLVWRDEELDLMTTGPDPIEWVKERVQRERVAKQSAELEPPALRG